MRIAHLLPGTGSFHCGTCLRDRALLQALGARGHAVTVVPMYLPSFPPDPGAPAAVQMGAMNLWLRHVLPAWRFAPRWLRRWLDHPALLRRLSRSGRRTDPHQLGTLTVAMLRGEQGPFAAELQRLRQELAAVRPDVIVLSNVLLVGVVRALRATGAAIVVTLQGEAGFVDALPPPHRERAWELLRERCADVDAFVAVSSHYRDAVAPRLGLPAARVHVVHNGLPLAADAVPAPPAPPPLPTVGYLARLCPQKGLPLLVEAFVALRARPAAPPARLRLAGVLRAEDRPLVAALQARLQQHGLAADVDWLPDLDDRDKTAFLRSLSVLSVPADPTESFGLFVLEAMAQGVPVVQPAHGPFPEVLAHGGGLLCPPDDAEALAATLATVLAEPALARSLGAAGQQAVGAHFTAARMAAAAEAVYASALSRPQERA